MSAIKPEVASGAFFGHLGVAIALGMASKKSD